jgi:hypothetical protein
MVSNYSVVGTYVLEDSSKTGKDRIWICNNTEYADGVVD